MKKSCLILFCLLAACAGKKPASVSHFVGRDVYFGSGSSKVQAGELEKLKAAVSYLKKHPKQILLIEGHTDKKGSANYNMDLGDKRARAVKAFLITAGISSDHILTVSYGESKPKSKKLSENRRVFISELKK